MGFRSSHEANCRTELRSRVRCVRSGADERTHHTGSTTISAMGYLYEPAESRFLDEVDKHEIQPQKRPGNPEKRRCSEWSAQPNRQLPATCCHGEHDSNSVVPLPFSESPPV